MKLNLIPFKTWNDEQNCLSFGFTVFEESKEAWDWAFQITVGVIYGSSSDTEEWMDKQADRLLEEGRWAAEAILDAAARR